MEPCNGCACCTAHRIITQEHHRHCITSPSHAADAEVAKLMRAVYFGQGEYCSAVHRVRNNPELWPYKHARQAEDQGQRRREWEDMVAQFRKSRATNLSIGNEMSVPPSQRQGESAVQEGREGANERAAEVAGGREGSKEQSGGIVEQESREAGEIAVPVQQPTCAELSVVPKRAKEGVKQKPEQQQQGPDPVPEPNRTGLDVFEASAPVKGS